MPGSAIVRSLVESTAFEHIFERCPDHDGVRRWIASHFKGKGPNPVHLAIAELVRRGVVQHVITTNYDLGFEEAFAHTSLTVHRIVGEGDAKIWDTRAPALFKIHGSVDVPNSLIFALRHESAMPHWKRDVLHAMIHRRGLLVAGYSGTDFEICPELASTEPLDCVWNAFDDPMLYPDALTGNARSVSEALAATVLVGDMRGVWTHLGGRCDDAVRHDSEDISASALVASLSPREAALWASQVLVGIGCGTAAESLIASMHADSLVAEADSGLVAGIKGQALFHRGLYARASREFRAAARWHFEQGDIRSGILEKGREADSLRCYGSWGRSSYLLDEIETMVDPVGDGSIEGLVARQRALLTRHRLDLATMLGRQQAARRLRAQAIPQLKRAYEIAARDGNWHDVRMCEMWADRMGIDPAEIAIWPTPPLRGVDGFRQLGYVVAVWMALRDDIVTGRADESTWDQVEKALGVAAAIGSNPEQWKLAALMLRARRGAVSTLGSRIVRAFLACEYSLKFRAFLVARAVAGAGV